MLAVSRAVCARPPPAERPDAICAEWDHLYSPTGLAALQPLMWCSHDETVRLTIRRTIRQTIPTCEHHMEPVSLTRHDGKRPDGLTLVRGVSGKAVIWVVTFASRPIPCRTSISSCRLKSQGLTDVELAACRKCSNYIQCCHNRNCSTSINSSTSKLLVFSIVLRLIS